MISVCVPYYRNFAMMVKQLNNWKSWGDDLKDQINFVVVDDGSPQGLWFMPQDLNLTLVKIKQNIPWNFSGAKNLLAYYVDTDWFLLHDIDYMFTEDSMRKLLQLDMSDPETFYNFKCIMASSGKAKPRDHYPISSFLVNIDTYRKAGGHDEDFCGHYTAHDNAIFWRLTRDPGIAKQVKVDEPFMTCYQKSQILDADTDHEAEGWSRDGARNRALLGDKRQKKKPWSTESLRFEWAVQQEFKRASK